MLLDGAGDEFSHDFPDGLLIPNEFFQLGEDDILDPNLENCAEQKNAPFLGWSLKQVGCNSFCRETPSHRQNTAAAEPAWRAWS
jgi:hypothetical protein